MLALKDQLKPHRTRQDGMGLLLGITIGLAPRITGERFPIYRVLNVSFSGIAILFIAKLELVRLCRWEEALELMLGIWVVVSPFVFGYAGSGSLLFAHWILGGLVAFAGGLELWQDQRKSREDLDRYGSWWPQRYCGRLPAGGHLSKANRKVGLRRNRPCAPRVRVQHLPCRARLEGSWRLT